MALALLLATVAVIVYAMSRGQDVREVKLSEGGLELSFAASGSVSTREIEEKQTKLEEQVRALERRAERTAATKEPQPGATADLNGDWLGANGLTYRIQQSGTHAVITEITPYGITAVGEGTVDRETATFGYQAVDGSQGRADLRLVNQSILEGTFRNLTFGTTVAVQMTR